MLAPGQFQALDIKLEAKKPKYFSHEPVRLPFDFWDV